jgi:hypothetical protein
MSISGGGSNNKRKKLRKVSFALEDASTYVLALMLLAAGSFAVISSTTTTPMTTAAIAQELGSNNTTTATGLPGGGIDSSLCTPLPQTDGGGNIGSQNSTANTPQTITVGGGTDATTGNATSTARGGGGSLSTSEIRDYIEEACIALQIDDIEGALALLNLALDELGDDGGGTQATSTVL